MTPRIWPLKLNQIFILALFSILITACGEDVCMTKNQFLDTFDAFIEESQTALEDTKDKTKRLEFEDRYKDIVNDCYKKHVDAMTLKERQDFWKKSVSFYIKGNSNFMEMQIGSVNDEKFNSYLEEQIELVIKDSGDEFASMLQEIITDNLSPGFNELMKGLENMSKELQEALEN